MPKIAVVRHVVWVFEVFVAVPYKLFAFFKRCKDNTRGEADGRCLESDESGL